MKRLLTLLIILATTGVTSMFAAITPGENQAWWGYVNNNTGLTGVGVASVDTYHCAIFIPGDHGVAGGKTINAVRFALYSQNVKDVKVWIATRKPSAINTTNCVQVVDVPNSELETASIEVALNEPYTITSSGVYVGYSFTITAVNTDADGYPVLVTGTDAPNTLILKTDNAVTTWTDLNGQGFGRLYLQVLLEGTFEDNLVTPSDFGPVYAKVGQSTAAKVSITNNGITPISNISYTITTDGETSQERQASLSNPIPAFCNDMVEVTIDSEDTQSIKEKTLTVTKVNGNDNQATANSAQFTLYSLNEIIARNVVVEQFTGTGCGWCPRGHVGMAKMRQTYGDRFIGIALHQYTARTNDAMNIAASSYAKLNFSGAPSCKLNRGEEIDPYYGSVYDIAYDFEEEMAIPALATVEVSGIYNEEQTKVDAQATVSPLFDGDYNLEFVIVADGLTGSGTGWNQSNYYAQYNSSELPEDLAPFGKGGEYGTSILKNFVFNDVAIASSYVSSKNKVAGQSIASGETADFSYTLSMPTYTKLKDALNMDEIYVIALFIRNGKIINAAKAKVMDFTTNVKGICTEENKEAVSYSLDGRQLPSSKKGLNIVRMADGSVRKVIIK